VRVRAACERSSLTTLSVLALSGNKIADPGMASLALAMPPCLATLNLNFNAIGGDGARALAAALPQSGLTVVYLDGNRSLPCTPIAPYTPALAPNAVSRRLFL
jgi:hypothetical protein